MLLLITDYRSACVAVDHREKEGEGLAAEITERVLGYGGDLNFVTGLKFVTGFIMGLDFV